MWMRWTAMVAVVAGGAAVLVVWMRYDAGHVRRIPSGDGVVSTAAAPSRPVGSQSRDSVQPYVAQGSPVHQDGNRRIAMTPRPPLITSAIAPAGGALSPRMDSVREQTHAPLPSVASASSVPAEQRHLPVAPSRVDVTDGLDAESAAHVRQILDSASAQGLPVTVLASRVREGVRRGVPGPRIVVVTRNLASALGSAKATLGASASSLEIQAGAEAMVAGAPTAALRQIRSARPNAAVTEPLLALTDLTTHGVAPLQASAALAALMARSRSDGWVQALRAHVVSDILRGQAPDAALADRIRQVAPALVDGGTDSLGRQPRTP